MHVFISYILSENTHVQFFFHQMIRSYPKGPHLRPIDFATSSYTIQSFW